MIVPQLPRQHEGPAACPRVHPGRSDGPGLSISVYPWRREVEVRCLRSAFGALPSLSVQKSVTWCMSLCVHSRARPGEVPSCPSLTHCTITPQMLIALTTKALKHKNNGLYILTLQFIWVKQCVHALDEFVLTCGAKWGGNDTKSSRKFGCFARKNLKVSSDTLLQTEWWYPSVITALHTNSWELSLRL